MTKKRCAIYTRKSTEEGLEQDFNSLDAQREACEAYIKSQQHEGWKLVKGRYDDGGISGGTMDRPALQALLSEVVAGRVDTIVVYKVDRLTRALSDFAKMVELFDEHDVSFVSVTQQFNTTSSMGRLTLNVLLSFAQFEREVTAERIRDKIAASKKKGMWMGGLPPLGYDNQDKKLVINVEEAETVRLIYQLYLEHRTVRIVQRELDVQGIRTKERLYRNGRVVGGNPYWRGPIYQILKNPIYAGRVRHHDQVYEGQHEAIIDQDTWESVQALLQRNGHAHRTGENVRHASVFTGMIHDEHGEKLTTSSSRKNEQAHRYYVSRQERRGQSKSDWRLPARELEKKVIDKLKSILSSRHQFLKLVSDAVDEIGCPDRFMAAGKGLAQKLETLSVSSLNSLFGNMGLALHLTQAALDIRICTLGLLAALNLKETPAVIEEVRITIPISLRRRGVERKIVIQDDRALNCRPDSVLIQTIANAYNWWCQLRSGEAQSIKDIAQTYGLPQEEVSRVLPLAFLSPGLVEAILDGHQPIQLTARSLQRMPCLPVSWREQKEAIERV